MRYLGQSLLMVGSFMLILTFLDLLSDAVIVASLGASGFIAFSEPQRPRSAPRFLVGGYLTGIVAAFACHLVSLLFEGSSLLFLSQNSMEISGAMAVGFSMFLMVVLNTEHPPASALALGLVLDSFPWNTALIALAGISLLSLVKQLLKPYLIDLL